MAAQHRHVAGLVDDAVLLLEGALMLLVDHDQAEIGIGQEQSRAGADHHAGLAEGHRPPVAPALGRAQLGMPFGRPHAEAGGEAVEPMRRQRDLRQQHQHLPSGRQRRRHRLEIDLGLAGAGDAVQQRGRIAAIGDRVDQPVRRLALGLAQHCPRPGQVRLRHRVEAGQQHGLEQPGLGHALDHPGAAAGLTRQLGRQPRRPVLQHRQDAPSGGAELRALGRQLRPAIGGDRLRRLQRPGRGQRHTQHRAGGRQSVAGDPVDEVARHLRQRRQVEAVQHRLQPRLRDLAGARPPDHADPPQPAQRHLDIAAGRKIHALRHRVIVSFCQGQRQQHPDRGDRATLLVDRRRCCGLGLRHGLDLPPRADTGAAHRPEATAGHWNEAHEVLHRYRRLQRNP